MRAAGAVGIVLVDNRPGEANGVPVQLAVPSGMISDFDGSALRSYLASRGGRTAIRVSRDPQELNTSRSGIVTSFSSGGLTAFGHQLKPDVGAPGAQILSATLKNFGGPFAVFDGTSMAAPHVAGAAALLLQHHPGWTAGQVKSALVSTAATAWADTARTVEAPVLTAGSGLINVVAANDPKLFTDPVSLSYVDLNVTRGPASKSLLLAVADAGDGAGTWTVEVKPQANPSGVQIIVPGTLTIAPGGDLQVPVTARAAADAGLGEAYGFLLLRRGDVVRKVAYAMLVTRPGLAQAPILQLGLAQTGDTRKGVSHASAYRYPAAAFGPAANYVGTPVNEDGAEALYRIRIDEPAVNVGAAVIFSTPGSLVHPWLLGSPDENDVQGYAGTPVNVNNLTLDFPLDIGAAATVFPRTKAYYVAVDSGRDQFTGRSLGGEYLLRAWVDDVQPPVLGLITNRVAAGRPTLALRVLDLGAGVDPFSLVVGYGQALVAAAAYDPVSGIAIFPLPREAPVLRTGQRLLSASAADFQEAKNVDSVGDELLPNTAFASGNITVVNGPVITWVTPEPNECAAAPADLLVIASSTVALRSVRFLDGTSRSPRSGAALQASTPRRGSAAALPRDGTRSRPSSPTRRAARPRPSASCASASRRREEDGRRHRRVERHRRGNRARARGAWLVLRARRPAAGATRAARVRARRRIRALRRLRSGASRPSRSGHPGASSANRPAREQRGYPGAWQLLLPRPGADRGRDAHELSRRRLVRPGVRSRAARGLPRRQRRLRRRGGGIRAGGTVRVLEARTTRVLPLAHRAARLARGSSAHHPSRLRRDRRVPAALGAQERVLPSGDHQARAGRGANRERRGVRESAKLFVPRWYRVFALMQALLPGLSARRVARSGYKRPNP